MGIRTVLEVPILRRGDVEPGSPVIRMETHTHVHIYTHQT